MDYSLRPPLEASVRSWRTVALVAGMVAVFELAVIIAAGIALFGKPLSREVKDAAAARVLAPKESRPPTPGDRVTPARSRRETFVLVLNGNGRTGAAAATAETVRARGYAIAGVGNASRSYGKSVVMYRRGYRAEGVRLARDLRIKLVGPVDGMRTSQLLGAQVALIVGS